MAELLLEIIEENLFDVGLDSKRVYDDYADFNYLTIICGDQHMDLLQLWSAPGAGDEDTYFFDSDDIVVKVFRYGSLDDSGSIDPEDEDELVRLVQKIFDEGLDSLRESS